MATGAVLDSEPPPSSPRPVECRSPYVAAHAAAQTPAHATGVAMGAADLFRAHAGFVASFLSRFGVAPADLDDMVQEVFLVVHRRGGFVEESAKPTTYLAGIAIRVASQLRRTRRRKDRADRGVELEALIDSKQNPYVTAETNESLRRVDRALAALDDDKRAVFILYEIQEQSCEDIAKGLAVPVGTVHSRLFAARKTFQSAYRTGEEASR